MKKYRISIFLGIVLILSAIIYSPTEMQIINNITKEDMTPKTSSSPIILKFGTSSGPISLDPHDAWDYNSWNVFDQVIETLFAYDLSDPELNIIPRLAADYGRWSIDGKRYIVPLKWGVTFHDGTPFNVDAVVWNFERLNYFMSLPDPSLISSLYRWPDGTPIINSVNIFNSTDVEFVLNRPFAAFEALLCASGSGIMSPSSTPAEDYIDLLTGDLVGTGPFEYVEYIENNEVRFHKYEDYWAGDPHIDELVFSIIPDSQDRTQALIDGEVDFVNTPDRTMLQPLRDNSDITLLDAGTDTIIRCLGMNNQLIPVEMRKAISYTLDYYGIIEEYMNGEAERLRSPIPLGIRYANWGFNVPVTNIITARQTLIDSGLYGILPSVGDDQGWIDLANTNPIAEYNLIYWWDSGDPRMPLLTIPQENLKKIGVNVIEEYISYQEYIRRGTEDRNLLELFWFGWGADYNDPYNYINSFFANDGSWNAGQVNDATLQAWIDDAESQLDEGLRESRYDQIQQRLVEEIFPWCWGFVGRNYDTYNNHFAGFQSNPLDKVWFYTVQLSLPQLNSNWLVNEVTIDGFITPGEWDDAIAYDITLDRFWSGSTEPTGKVLTVRFKNDEEWLYAFYEIPFYELTTEPEAAGFSWWGPVSDSGWVNLAGVTGDQYGWDGTLWYNDIDASGQNNMDGTGSFDSLIYRFEFRKELDSGDIRDWSLWLGQMVGSPTIPYFMVHLWDYEDQSTYGQFISLQLSRHKMISNWLVNDVILDGYMSSGEWTDAIHYEVPLYNAYGFPAGIWQRTDKTLTIHFKNDHEWLYGFYEIEWLGTESTPESAGISLHAFLENPRTTSDSAWVAIGGYTVDYYDWNGWRWSFDTEVLGQNDMEGMGINIGDYYRFEFRKRLDSNDGWDWALTPGGTVGSTIGPSILAVSLWDENTRSVYEQYISLDLSPAPSSLSWWPGDRNPFDIVGVNHGHMNYDTTFAPGKVDEGFYFDGIDDNIFIPNPIDINNLQQITIETWVRLDMVIGEINRFVTLTGEKAVLRHDGINSIGQLHFYMKIGGVSHDIRVDSALEENIFYHVAGTYDGEDMRLYLDGIEVGSLHIIGLVGSGSGVELSSDFEPLNGTLDEVTIYDRALRPEEIQFIYDAGANGKYKDDKELSCPEPIPITTNIKLTNDLYCQSDGLLILSDGIYIDGSGHKITGNGDYTGILIENHYGIGIRNLLIQNFDIGIHDGANSGGHNITVNYIADNNVGILLSSPYNIVTNNIIARNQLGVSVTSSSNAIYLNLLINNLDQIDDGGLNQWFEPYIKLGNFWSNYWGEDDGSGTGKHAIAGDYIGDTDLPHEGVDDYPLLDPSIPEAYGSLLYADWWMWGRGGSPILIQGVDPYGRIISVDVNEIGLNAFYIEELVGDTSKVMILIAINPQDPIYGTYTYEVTATEPSASYSLTTAISGNGLILFERTIEGDNLNEGHIDTFEAIIQEVEDPAPEDPPVIVEPGEFIRTDIGAPTVEVSQPGVSEHINTTSIDVVGIATDDSGVETITVNGVEVTPIPTGNPYDPNEVTFSTTVDNLVLGENVITIVVTDDDVEAKSTIVERTVILPVETDTLTFLLSSLQEIIDESPNTPLAEEIENIIDWIEAAYEELIKELPDYQVIMADLEKAVSDLEVLVKDGSLDPTEGKDLMDLMTALSQKLAINAIYDAIEYEGDQNDIDEAWDFLYSGDILREQEEFKHAIDKYKDALVKAEDAIT